MAKAATEERYCLIPGCENPEEAGGLCYGHRWRKKHGRDLSPPLRETGLSPYERVLEAIREMEHYDGDEREHAWKARLRAAVKNWILPRRLKHRRRKRLPRRREVLK